MPHKTAVILLLTLSITLLAQTKKPAKGADKKVDGPTAVSGKPTTTASPRAKAMPGIIHASILNPRAGGSARIP